MTLLLRSPLLVPRAGSAPHTRWINGTSVSLGATYLLRPLPAPSLSLLLPAQLLGVAVCLAKEAAKRVRLRTKRTRRGKKDMNSSLFLLVVLEAKAPPPPACH